jgi:Zinc carboxypeptidase
VLVERRVAPDNREDLAIPCLDRLILSEEIRTLMRNSLQPTWALILLTIGLSTVRAADVPSPESHLGYKPGADFRLANWPTVADYVRKVDLASDRVVVQEMGKTTEGRPLLVAIVSNEATIRDLDRYKKLQKAIADPGEDVEANRFTVLESKPVVLITCSIHSSETASTLMAIELLHELATRNDPATREILDNTILLLVPSINPDGVDKVASWYDQSKGKPWEGEGMPTLYHFYAGHDTNRDWFMLNLKETQHLTRLLYKEWFPTIAYDVHQMGSKGARLFVPPFYDPINPNVDPRINQGIFQIGAHMAADLASAGKKGVLTNAMYDNWMSGGNRTTTHRHNIVAVLTEAASVKLASPIYLDKSDLKGVTRGFSSHEPAANFVDPWPGGWWRLRDIVDYELIAARSLMTLAARYRQQFQSNYLAMGRDAIKKGRDEPPFAWIVPAEQRDPGTAAKLVAILRDSGIKVHSAEFAFTADGVPYPAGSWVLPADQPYRAHLKDVMERQVYPNRIGANGTPEAPYDNAAWTLQLQMGVTSAAVGTRFTYVPSELERSEPPRGLINGSASPEFYTIRNQSNDDFRVLNALLAAGIEVRALRYWAHSGSDNLPAGTMLFKATPEARAVLDRVIPKVSTKVEGRVGLTALPTGELRPITYRLPRVAHYQPWVPIMDEGWARFVFDSFEFPYTVVHDAEVRAGSLSDRFDTILISSISAGIIREGYKADATEPGYVGGLRREGVDAIRAFVRDGGTLVCLEASTQFAIEEFGLPVTNVLRNLKSSEFYSPGSIFHAEAVKSSVADRSITFDDDLTVGMPDEFSVWFDNSQAFELAASKPGDRPNPGRIVANYAKINTLDSGWLLGPEKVQGKAALVKFRHEKGRIILFGFSPHHRGQPHGTFRLLFNSLYPLD